VVTSIFFFFLKLRDPAQKSEDSQNSSSLEKTLNEGSEEKSVPRTGQVTRPLLATTKNIPLGIQDKKTENMGSEEDPRDYDLSRQHFRIGFIIASVSGILMWLFMFIFIFHYNGGLTWGTNQTTEINLHIVLMTFFVIYLQGHGSLAGTINSSF